MNNEIENEIELSVVIPCLNEEETLAAVINKIKHSIEENNLSAEIVIADNGSTDNSISIAKELGARVVNIKKKGYGSAVYGGVKAAKGKYCIMGDADDSYDFLRLMNYVKKLREGYDFVIGNRFKGGIEEGAMPWTHRYIGTPAITLIGKILFGIKGIGDFNCGMRGFNREKMVNLKLRCPGMEFASEMIIECVLNDFSIAEIPTRLFRDGRSKSPHLHSWRDGNRHLRYLLARWVKKMVKKR